MSKTQSKLGVTIGTNIRPVPILDYEPPVCSTTYGTYEVDMCGVGTYTGWKIDANCDCGTSDVHTFTVTNTTVDGWEIDYLGGTASPVILSQDSTTLTFDLSGVVAPTTAMFCHSGVTDSVFEIKAYHDFSYIIIKVIAISC